MKKREYEVNTKYRIYEMDGSHLEIPTEWEYGYESRVFFDDYDSTQEAEQAILNKVGLSGEFVVLPVINKQLRWAT